MSLNFPGVIHFLDSIRFYLKQSNNNLISMLLSSLLGSCRVPNTYPAFQP